MPWSDAAVMSMTGGSAMTTAVMLGETMAAFTAARPGPAAHVEEWRLGMGGAESNVAIGLQRLGVATTWLGRVGDDSFGRLVLQRLRGEGVAVDHVVVDPEGPTGLMTKERRGARTAVSYYRTGSAGSRLGPTDVPADLIAGARVLHVSGVTAAISASAHAAVVRAIDLAVAAGALVSFDLNDRRRLWSAQEAAATLRPLVARADLCYATAEEAALLVGPGDDAGATAARLADLGPAEVVVKRGAHGAVAMVDGRLHAVDAVATTVVDPVGAGDAFCAGYLAAVLEGRDVDGRLSQASLTASVVLGVDGDWEGLPTRAELAAAAEQGGDPDTVR